MTQKQFITFIKTQRFIKSLPVQCEIEVNIDAKWQGLDLSLAQATDLCTTIYRFLALMKPVIPLDGKKRTLTINSLRRNTGSRSYHECAMAIDVKLSSDFGILRRKAVQYWKDKTNNFSTNMITNVSGGFIIDVTPDEWLLETTCVHYVAGYHYGTELASKSDSSHAYYYIGFDTDTKGRGNAKRFATSLGTPDRTPVNTLKLFKYYRNLLVNINFK